MNNIKVGDIVRVITNIWDCVGCEIGSSGKVTRYSDGLFPYYHVLINGTMYEFEEKDIKKVGGLFV